MELYYRRRLPHWREDDVTYFVTWRLASGQHELDSWERDLVVSAMRRFDGERYQIAAYVVMDDHVHALVTPLPKYRLQDILHSWKSFTARQVQRDHKRAGFGSTSTSIGLFATIRSYWRSSITSYTIRGNAGQTSRGILGCGRLKYKVA